MQVDVVITPTSRGKRGQRRDEVTHLGSLLNKSRLSG